VHSEDLHPKFEGRRLEATHDRGKMMLRIHRHPRLEDNMKPHPESVLKRYVKYAYLRSYWTLRTHKNSKEPFSWPAKVKKEIQVELHAQLTCT
jgi:hypothetical protein